MSVVVTQIRAFVTCSLESDSPQLLDQTLRACRCGDGDLAEERSSRKGMLGCFLRSNLSLLCEGAQAARPRVFVWPWSFQVCLDFCAPTLLGPSVPDDYLPRATVPSTAAIANLITELAIVFCLGS